MKSGLDFWYESWKRVDSQNGRKLAQNPKGDTPGRTPNTSTQVSKHPKDARPYSWLEDYFPRLAGKEQRQEYYTRLERTPPVG